MDKALKQIMFIFVFLILFSLVVYTGNLKHYKESIKNSLDLATKAASLQINTDPLLISQGIFQIDPIRAKQAFISVMAYNLNTTEERINNGLINFSVINVASIYTDPINHKNYNVQNPTIFATSRFIFNMPMYKKGIIIDNNFAGSQLTKK